MRRMVSICLALASVLAIGATAAQTALARLTLSNGAPLAPGYRFEIYGRQNVFIPTPINNIECIEEPSLRSGLFVKVLANEGIYGDSLEVIEPTGALGGGELCRTPPSNRWGRAQVIVRAPI